MPPRHAQEKETVKPKRPAKLIAAAEKNITIIRENVPVMALTGVAFGASYGHIAKLCGDFGPHGWVQYATAGCVDLLCIIGAEERQRDKRIGRDRSWGFVSWPTLVLVVGILVTLAANVATADRHPFGYFVAAWPAGALLLAVSILERRTSHSGVTAAEREAALQADLQRAELDLEAAREETAALAVEAGQDRAALVAEAEREQAALKAELEAAQQRATEPPKPPRKQAAPKPRANRGEEQTEEQKLGIKVEALAILADEPDISGSELGRRLEVQEGYGRKLKRELSPAAPGGDS